MESTSWRILINTKHASEQCDQIGIFLKERWWQIFLQKKPKFLTSNFLGYFEKCHLWSKDYCCNFLGHFWKKLDYFLFQRLVTLRPNTPVITYSKNWPTPASFLFIFVLFKHKFNRITVVVNRIRTRIVRVEGEQVDHLTTTTTTTTAYVFSSFDAKTFQVWLKFAPINVKLVSSRFI